MPSSTSSSDPGSGEFQRIVPARPWMAVLGATLVATFLITAAWEVRCRASGDPASMNDTQALWALEREKLRRSDGSGVVIIGSSRVFFGLDLDVLAGFFGSRPIQLAIVGSCPRPVLADLAADSGFRGTVLCGVTPGLFFAGGGPPIERSQDFLDFWRKLGPAQRWGQRLGMALEPHLLMMQDDFKLGALLGRLGLPDRPDARVKPRLPPRLGSIDADRRCWMLPRLEQDPSFQQEIQEIWKVLFNAAPPLDAATLEKIRTDILASVQEDVAKIRSRGGRVLFLRLPSTGPLRELERASVPRETHWDELLKVTGSPGIHFEDHASLSRFTCPEWSHLRREDSVRYTREMVTIMQEIDFLPGPGSAP